MSKLPAFMFYPGDWMSDPGLRACSISTRGLWIDMLCKMHVSNKYGYFLAGDKTPTIEESARMVGTTPEEFQKGLDELVQFKVCSVDASGRVFSRRMLKDFLKRKAWTKRQKKHRKNLASIEAEEKQELTDISCHADVTQDVTSMSPCLSSSSSSSSLKELKELKTCPNSEISDVPSESEIKNQEEETPKPKPKIFPDDSPDMCLSKFMFDKIREINPKAMEPNFQSWARDMDLLMRIDKKEAFEINEMIEKVYQHNFWHKNILSPAALRKQWDRLYLEFKNGNGKARAGPRPNYVRTYDTTEAPMILGDIMKGVLGK